MHQGVTMTVGGREVEPEEHIRVSWPGGPSRAVTAEQLINVMARDDGWEELATLVNEYSQARISVRDLRRLREAAGEPGPDGGDGR